MITHTKSFVQIPCSNPSHKGSASHHVNTIKAAKINQPGKITSVFYEKYNIPADYQQEW